MVQVSIVTESLLQVAALMQRQRRSSELLKFRQVAASKGTIIRTALFDAWNVWLGCWWFRREISRWVFFRSTFHGFVTIFLCWYLITSSQVASFDSSILGYIWYRGFNEKFIKAIGYRLSDRAYFRDLLYRSGYMTGYIYIYIDLSILRVSVALSNKRENNNVIE